MNTSNLFKLNFNDISKGLLMAVLVPIISISQQSLAAGNFVFNYKTIVMQAVGGLLAYLVKNFMTNSQGLPFSAELDPNDLAVDATVTKSIVEVAPVTPIVPTAAVTPIVPVDTAIPIIPVITVNE